MREKDGERILTEKPGEVYQRVEKITVAGLNSCR